MTTWIVLTDEKGIEMDVRADDISIVRPTGILGPGVGDPSVTPASHVWINGSRWLVKETRDEVRALLGIDRFFTSQIPNKKYEDAVTAWQGRAGCTLEEAADDVAFVLEGAGIKL